jgi:hypothetical protein
MYACSYDCNCFDLGIIDNGIHLCVYRQKEAKEQVTFSSNVTGLTWQP